MNIRELTKGIFKENPTFVMLLGLCPTLAVSTQVINAIAMGVAVLFVLTMSNIIISLIRGFVPKNIRIPIFIVVIASFVTIVEMVMDAYFPKMAEALGVFIPLIVVNCIILGRAEAFASKNSVGNSALDGIGVSIGFTLSLTLIALIREIFGSGTITLKIAGIGTVINLSSIVSNPAVVMILPPGGFLTMGLLLGFFNHLKNKKEERLKKQRAKAKATQS